MMQVLIPVADLLNQPDQVVTEIADRVMQMAQMIRAEQPVEREEVGGIPDDLLTQLGYGALELRPCIMVKNRTHFAFVEAGDIVGAMQLRIHCKELKRARFYHDTPTALPTFKVFERND